MRPALRSFLEEAGSAYDLVIVDAPPALAVSETAVLVSLADAYLVVILSGRTSRKLVRITMQQLNSRGGHLLGVVLNNLDMSRMGNYGAYNYYYSYYGYDYRYEDEPQEETERVPSEETAPAPEGSETPDELDNQEEMDNLADLEALDGGEPVSPETEASNSSTNMDEPERDRE